MQHLIRPCFCREGYSYAKRAEDVAREHGFDRIARLASNENPRPPSPLAIEAAGAALLEGNRYPDERTADLCTALCRYHGDYHFVTGAGMDGVIETVIRTVVEPGGRIVVATPTFSFYGIAGAAHGAAVGNVPRREDFSVNPETFIDACSGARLAFLCSPNNPTGNATPTEAVREILEGIDCLLFLDNAYVDFSAIDYRPLMREYDNLILGRTMSKIFSLAGLRVGYAFVPGWFAPYYQRAATPFALNAVSAAAAAGALRDREHVTATCDHVRRWRERFLTETPFAACPSDANFVMLDVAPHTGDEVVDLLATRGVLVRSCTSFPDLGNHYIRVSIGDDWENIRFLEAITAL
ncbi:histidinol-phosphate transaminase [Methanoculleus sp. FWC-SCC1]|uniref:Histidinol-phosphate aminotransferase n=1 Tax=Methanoculleus frigidifontis TaxID=2584085 RepID=A0ABT8MCG0_9EURY|nr:aminotransferase class I/II-fold pyridoxal phosphate-dependent enzyme [Methanoculleus sp. FWC-SCC1]MDN7025576.1 histidinol-phosphate transaminase [Methanoculleus sp. FWC-SCC1]